MKCLNTDSKPARIPANFIKRDEPVVTVKGGVFESLGHNRAGQLLKFQDELTAVPATVLAEVSRKFEQKNIAQKIEDRRISIRKMFASVVYGLFDPALLTVRNRPGLFGNVSAIDRKAGDQFGNDTAQL